MIKENNKVQETIKEKTKTELTIENIELLNELGKKIKQGVIKSYQNFIYIGENLFKSEATLDLNNSFLIVILQGTTTSQVNQSLKSDNPYPARVFLKVSNFEEDIPVFFKVKEKVKIKKGSLIEVKGYFSDSIKNDRSSFTAWSYRMLNYDEK